MIAFNDNSTAGGLDPEYRVNTRTSPGSGTGDTKFHRTVRDRDGRIVREDRWLEGPSAAFGSRAPKLPEYIKRGAQMTHEATYSTNDTAPVTMTPAFSAEEARVFSQYLREPETKAQRRMREFEESIEALGLDLKKSKAKAQKRGRCRRHRQFQCNVAGC